MDRVKLGVLGISGHFIKRVLFPIQRLDNLEVYGVASRNGDKALQTAQNFGIPKSYDSYDALLADPEINMVYLPLPNHLHAEWIKKSADAGKHILCEKPIAMDAEEAQECLTYAEGKGVKVMEAFMYMMQPQWQHAKELVMRGEIGKVQGIHTFFCYNNPDPENIRNILKYGGGALMDIGCYAVSVPRFILDSEPTKVISLLSRDDEFGTDILTSAILDFENTRSVFTVSTKCHPYQQISIHGTGGTITVKIPFNTYPDVPAEINVTTGQGSRDVVFDIYDQFGIEFEEFANAIIHDEPAPISTTDAVNNMKVLDALFKSAYTNSWQEV